MKIQIFSGTVYSVADGRLVQLPTLVFDRPQVGYLTQELTGSDLSGFDYPPYCTSPANSITDPEHNNSLLMTTGGQSDTGCSVDNQRVSLLPFTAISFGTAARLASDDYDLVLTLHLVD